MGVSEATVVRFAHWLGYPGFPVLQAELKARVLQELTTVERLQEPGRLPDGRGRGTLAATVRQESDNVVRLLRVNRPQVVRTSVGMLRSSETVRIAGMQSSASLAYFFGFHLGKARSGVSWFDSADIRAYHEVARMTRRDVLCVLGFPRYPRALVELARFAGERELPVLVVTDSEISPLASLGTSTLYAPSASPSFVDGYAAPICLINALVSELARSTRSRAKRSLAAYETAAVRAAVFVKR